MVLKYGFSYFKTFACDFGELRIICLFISVILEYKWTNSIL